MDNFKKIEHADANNIPDISGINTTVSFQNIPRDELKYFERRP